MGVLGRRLAGVDVPDRVVQLLGGVLGREFAEEGQVIVHHPRDGVEVEALGGLGLLVHEQRQAFRRRVFQPVLHRQSVALGLGDLLALVVEEQLVGQVHGGRAAQDAGDAGGQLHRRDQVLAAHLVVDAQGHPAHAPVGLPLQLAGATGHRRLHQGTVLVLVDDGAGLDVALDHRHLQHHPGLGADRQERRIGGAPLRPQGRQHHVDDGVIMAQHPQQGLIEPARHVPVGGRLELVGEAEPVEEAAQPGVVVVAEALMGAERVGDAGQRLAQMLADHLLVGDVVGHLAQPVHVVGKGEQAAGDLGSQDGQGAPDHGGAGHFAEGADMGQARRAVAGLEQDIALVRRLAFQPLVQQGAGLLERPGGGGAGEGGEIGHGEDFPFKNKSGKLVLPGAARQPQGTRARYAAHPPPSVAPPLRAH